MKMSVDAHLHYASEWRDAFPRHSETPGLGTLPRRVLFQPATDTRALYCGELMPDAGARSTRDVASGEYSAASMRDIAGPVPLETHIETGA